MKTELRLRWSRPMAMFILAFAQIQTTARAASCCTSAATFRLRRRREVLAGITRRESFQRVQFRPISGRSSYLLFCKYNDYATGDGSGVNRVAILDPNTTQLDPHSGSAGLVEMREVLTVIGPTRDSAIANPLAVKEWCINAPAVNPATNSVFFNNEDGRAYRWNLATNSLDQSVVLNAGLGQPYVPTVIGPDGTVFTLNGGNLFALGNRQCQT